MIFCGRLLRKKDELLPYGTTLQKLKIEKSRWGNNPMSEQSGNDGQLVEPTLRP